MANLVSFSLVFIVVAAAAAQAHEIDLCAKADYVPLCRSVVKGGSDPKAALQTSIEHLMLETKRAKVTSAKMGKMSSLDVCTTNFDSAIDSLQQSIKYLNSNDKASLNIELSAAMTFYVTCDDAVAEGGLVQKVAGLLTTDTMMRNMASNCLYLSSLIH